MLRFFDPQEGVIRLGGRDVRDIPLEELRERLSVVTQDTYLFHGTVADNLRFGNPRATQDELEEAARAANAHEFIHHLPQGYETVVGERAVRLSGGQKQRIAIARALLKDAPILILDEALSSVDAENEALIVQALDRLIEGRTTPADSSPPVQRGKCRPAFSCWTKGGWWNPADMRSWSPQEVSTQS